MSTKGIQRVRKYCEYCKVNPVPHALSKWCSKRCATANYFTHIRKTEIAASRQPANGKTCKRPGCGKPLHGRQRMWCSMVCSSVVYFKAHPDLYALFKKQGGNCPRCHRPLLEYGYRVLPDRLVCVPCRATELAYQEATEAGREKRIAAVKRGDTGPQ